MSNKKRRSNPYGPVGKNGQASSNGHSKVSTSTATKEFSLAEQNKQYTTLSTVMERYDLVEVVENYGDPFVIVAERGSSSVSPFTSWVRREYNQDLVGIKGLQQYDKMRKSDGTVKGTLRAVKTPVLSARWFVEPDDNTKTADKNAADFVWDNLTHMSITWPQFLIESLLMCEFG